MLFFFNFKQMFLKPSFKGSFVNSVTVESLHHMVVFTVSVVFKEDRVYIFKGSESEIEIFATLHIALKANIVLCLGADFVCLCVSVECLAFVLSLFVPHRPFFWCLGKVVLCYYGISRVSSLKVTFKRSKTFWRISNQHLVANSLFTTIFSLQSTEQYFRYSNFIHLKSTLKRMDWYTWRCRHHFTRQTFSWPPFCFLEHQSQSEKGTTQKESKFFLYTLFQEQILSLWSGTFFRKWVHSVRKTSCSEKRSTLWKHSSLREQIHSLKNK